MSTLQEKPSALKTRTSSSSKNAIYNLFLCLWVLLPASIRIRIENTDPDPQHCLLGTVLTYRTAYNKSPSERKSLKELVQNKSQYFKNLDASLS